MNDNSARRVETQEQDVVIKQSKSGRHRYYLWWLPAIAVAAAALFFAIGGFAPTVNDPESKLYTSALGYPSQQRKAGLPIEAEVTELTDKSFSNCVAAAGETVALVDVEIRSQVTGLVKKVFVEEGQFVEQGDVLLRMETGPWEDVLTRKRAALEISRLDIDYYPQLHIVEQAELEAKVQYATNHLEIARRRLGRYTSLREESAASAEEIAIIEELVATRTWELAVAEKEMKEHLLDAKKEISEAKHSLAVSEATVREAARDLKNTTINAPCDGLVTSLLVQSGELLLEDKEEAVRLANDVVFKAFIDQTRVDAVREGDSAAVRLVAEPGKIYGGTVIRVNPSVDTQGRPTERGRVDTRFTYSAWVKLDESSLPPGLQGHVEFRKDITRSVIPESAVIHFSSGEGMVMLIRDGRAVITRVELGKTRGPLREVKSGLHLGDQVVLNPLGLEANDLVQPIKTKSGVEQQYGADQELSSVDTRG